MKKITPRSFFRVQRSDGRWWIIDPLGQRFLSKGVTSVRMDADRVLKTDVCPYLDACNAKYSSAQAWRETTARRLFSWGLNTLGAWSDNAIADVPVQGRRLAYAPILYLGGAFVAKQGKGDAWLHGVFPDVFDPGFEKIAYSEARRQCTPRAGDPWLLGWFTDNEMRWGADWRGSDDLLSMFLKLPKSSSGYKAARDYAPDRNAFLAALAERYFRISRQAIRAADPNHMIFGCRFAYVPGPPVAAAAAKYLDAISINCYEADPRNIIESYESLGRPIIIGEYSFRGDDSGLYNTKGAGVCFKTQSGRAGAYKKYVSLALSNPHIVGYHWFEHADEPKLGRPDGENSNYGLVNIKDQVYTKLTEAMKALNARAEALHGRAVAPLRRVPLATHSGVLALGDGVVPCHVLDNDRRVLDRAAFTRVLTGTSGPLERHLSALNLLSYINPDAVPAGLTTLRLAVAPKAEVKGISADLALEICRGFVAALHAGPKVLSAAQRPLAIRSAGILAACAQDGLDTLIDEATGALYERVASLPTQSGLEIKLRKWESYFPGELFGEFERLVHRPGSSQQRPRYWSKILAEVVYAHLSADVIHWLLHHEPRERNGQDYQQWLASQFGFKRAVDHIWGICAFAKQSTSMLQFRRIMAQRGGRRLAHMIVSLPDAALKR